jgi:hypothetical protein
MSCSDAVSHKENNVHSWYSLWSLCSRCQMKRTPLCLWVPHVRHHAAFCRWGLQTHLWVCLNWVLWACIPGFHMTDMAPEASPLMLILRFTMPSMLPHTYCTLSDQEKFRTKWAIHGVNKGQKYDHHRLVPRLYCFRIVCIMLASKCSAVYCADLPVRSMKKVQF